MKKLNLLTAAAATMLISNGCSTYSTKPTSTVLPTSNKSIDVVLHRGDVRLMDCATIAVLQTYSEAGKLIDSKEARGTALHCTVLPALIDAGGRVGAGAATRPAISNIRNTVSGAINNANSNNQSQSQEQGQGQTTSSTSSSTSTSTSAGGAGGQGGAGGNGGGQGSNGGSGNNGGGNGAGDGTNPGTDHHHDNGDGN